MTTYLRYHDPRYGDTYEFYVDAEGDFVSACRSVEQLGRDPIYYDNLADIPPSHRNEIERMIEENRKHD